MKKFFVFCLAISISSTSLISQCSSKKTAHYTSYSSDRHDNRHNDIVDVAASSSDFATLVAAVKAADLVDVLQSEGPFTVFAPNDEAFAKLPPGTIQTLLQNIPQLARILTYHVVPGKVMSSDIAGKELSTATVEGSTVDINATNGVMIDGANVVTADIDTSNGVIHVIDKVIMP